MTSYREFSELIYACVVLCGAVLVGVAHADVTAERLSADQLAKAAAVTLSLHDLNAAEMVEAFTKQTGIEIALDLPDRPDDGGPSLVYELDLSDAARHDAVLELARVLGLNITAGLGRTSIRNPAQGYGKPAGSNAVQVGAVTRRQSKPPSDRRPDVITLDLALPEPAGGRPSQFSPQAIGLKGIILKEALDDRGQTLSDAYPGNKTQATDPKPQFNSSETFTLSMPSLRPNRLTKLSGVVSVTRAKTMLRIAVDAFDNQPMTTSFEDATISVAPLTQADGAFVIEMRIEKEQMDNTMSATLLQAHENGLVPVVRSDDGAKLTLRDLSRATSDRSIILKVAAQPAVVPRSAKVSGGPTHQPAPRVPVRPHSFEWQTVIESFDEVVSFEFKDVVIP